MPSITVDDSGEPCFVVPVSGRTGWECEFYFVKREGGEWTWQPIAETNHTWPGSHLTLRDERTLTAYLVVGDADGEPLSYGGGEVQEWVAMDGKSSWRLNRRLVPEPGLLYNNPRPVELAKGGELGSSLVFYGWEWPDSIDPPGSAYGWAGPETIRPGDRPVRPSHNRGRAYLWHDGEWL